MFNTDSLRWLSHYRLLRFGGVYFQNMQAIRWLRNFSFINFKFSVRYFHFSCFANIFKKLIKGFTELDFFIVVIVFIGVLITELLFFLSRIYFRIAISYPIFLCISLLFFYYFL